MPDKLFAFLEISWEERTIDPTIANGLSRNHRDAVVDEVVRATGIRMDRS